MSFEWIEFFRQNRIYYVEGGPNTSGANIAIRCPMCGNSDESEHMSVSLEGKGFRCWRQPLHSGKNPAKLIQALLHCSWNEALAIAGKGKTLPSDFMDKVRQTTKKEFIVQPRSQLTIPEEFKAFSFKPSCRPFLEYLAERGFVFKNPADITKKWSIYYATQGLYRGRILFTATNNKELVGWTGRTIYDIGGVRYKTLTNSPEKAEARGETPAPAALTDYLLFWDRIKASDADTIVLCEGPFDAWKTSILGEGISVVATCFFTSAISDAQINLLYEELPRFKNKYLLLDQGTFSKAERIRNKLSVLGVTIKHLPAEFKDPGELQTSEQLKKVLEIV